VKRSFIVVLCLLAMSIALPSISAQTSDLTVTVTQNANMRDNPDASSDRLTVLRAGTRIRLDGRTESGNWVRGIVPAGYIGWISSGTTDITLAQINGLRVVTPAIPFILEAPVPGAPAAPAAPGGGSGEGGTGVNLVATADVNMRSGPGTSFRRIDGVNVGTQLNADGRDAGQGWVRGINANGTVGWVSATYLSISPDQLVALPVVDIDTPFGLGAPVGETVPEATDPLPVAPLAPPVTGTTNVRGFNLGGHVQGFGENAVNNMRVAGMTWVKKQYRYRDGQNPNDVAGMINEAHSRGFRIVVGVVGFKDEIGNNGYYDRYASFVGGVAGLGADAIEIWNEPNIDREWTPGQINPASYTDLLARSYNAIKATNPNTMVISGAPAPTGFFGGCSGGGCDDDDFLAGMAAAGAANYMDCVGVHYNEGILPPTARSGDPRGNSGHYTRYFGPMMDVYSGAFGGRVPLCFTEIGYLSPEGYGPLSPGFAWASNVTVAQQAAWIDQAVSIAANSGRVRLMIIWNVDFTNYGDDPMAGYAIIRPGGGCPACEALSR